MPPLEAKENRIEDAIATELQKIGVVGGAGAWLTAPTFAIGVPLDGLTVQSQPQLYLQFVRTEPQPAESGTYSHWSRATWHLWCASTDVSTADAALRVVKNLKADVLRALYAGEGAINTVGASGNPWPGTFELHPELARGGAMVGVFEIVADFDTTHTSDP